MEIQQLEKDSLALRRKERIEKYQIENPLKPLRKTVRLNPNADLADFPYDIVWIAGFSRKGTIDDLRESINRSLYEFRYMHEQLDEELAENGPTQRLTIHIPLKHNPGMSDTFYCIVSYNLENKSEKFRFMLPSAYDKNLQNSDPDSFDRISSLALAHREQLTAIAEKLKGPFNDFVQRAPQSTLEEKKRLGRWITAELAQYGLAVECPNNPGLAVEVKGDSGNRPSIGRFQFLPLEGEGGGRKQRVYRDVLPDLSFVQITNSVDLSPSAKPEPVQQQR